MQSVGVRLRFEVVKPPTVVTYNNASVSFNGNFVSFDIDASGRVDDLLSDARSAVLISTNYGSCRVAGVRSLVEQVAGVNYIVDMNVELLNPRYADAANALRLIDGNLWELR